jgi:hypothetical protein
MMLSDSVISLVRVLDAKSGRRCDEIERKNGQVAKAAGFNPVVPAGGSIRDITASQARGRNEQGWLKRGLSPTVGQLVLFDNPLTFPR